MWPTSRGRIAGNTGESTEALYMESARLGKLSCARPCLSSCPYSSFPEHRLLLKMPAACVHCVLASYTSSGVGDSLHDPMQVGTFPVAGDRKVGAARMVRGQRIIDAKVFTA